MMTSDSTPTWHFIDDDGTFELASPDSTSFLYLPLVNHAGMMSSVTPRLHGDIKTGQNTFLTRPVSVEDLHDTAPARAVWIAIEGHLPWSATGGRTPVPGQDPDGDGSVVQAGLLWQTVTRRHRPSGLLARITNLVPEGGDQVELMRLTLTNEGDSRLRLTVTAAVPIFGRSADHLRDHRHVTSLLNRVTVHTHGVIVRPSLSFDERGHSPNEIHYTVLGCEQDGAPPAEIFPMLAEFRGEGGSLDWPAAVVEARPSPHQPGEELEGCEALGGARFRALELDPGQSYSYILVMGIYAPPATVGQLLERYGDAQRFETWQARTGANWKDRLDAVRVRTADARFNGWMRWVSVQPTLRQLFGNSFLPYHDYGRGGRGWRDLWQDILGLLLMQPGDVSPALLEHFAGVRFDGSNASIIGHLPGEFKADRNNIARVWMDHGAWPLLTTRLYIDWTGDLDFLLREQTYFKDHHTHRSRRVDHAWDAEQGTRLPITGGSPYQGTILEHLLVENLVPFFNVGEHNCILLEDADWNDALDMARERGESVAFTGFYAGNLDDLADLVDQLGSRGVQQISVARELTLLLDTLFEPVAYEHPTDKQRRLEAYLVGCAHTVTGERITVPLQALTADLRAKAAWLKRLLREQEWLEHGDHGWFNGYYDDLGRRVEGVFGETVQMTLAGQVFQLMFGVASDSQAQHIAHSVERYLYDPDLHGVRLNTRFAAYTDALGRVFGFAYGHKENGAMFSHMAVMYAYALFKRGLHQQGNRILRELYTHCQDFQVSRIYPGLPEYLDPRGRGRYPYLTGAASWYLLTLVTQAFGVRGHLGDLLIAPALDPAWFDEAGQASVRIPFAGRGLEIVLHNPGRLDPSRCRPARVEHAGAVLPAKVHAGGLLIPRQVVEALQERGWPQLDVRLEETA